MTYEEMTEWVQKTECPFDDIDTRRVRDVILALLARVEALEKTMKEIK